MTPLATSADVQRGFDTSAVINKLNGLENGLCDGFYAINTGLLTGFNGVNMNICNLSHEISDCLVAQADWHSNVPLKKRVNCWDN